MPEVLSVAGVIGEAAGLVGGRRYVVAATVEEAKPTRRGAMVYGRLGGGSASLPFRCWSASGVVALLHRHGLELARGFDGVFSVTLSVHERWGLQVDIVDVDVASVSAASAHLAAGALSSRIVAEGKAVRQRGLLPTGPPRVVGVVSSAGSQGLSDVVAQVAGRYEVRWWDAPMDGGEDTAGRVGAAVTAAAQAGCDVVAVVRGGGDATGMRWANDPGLVQTVLDCPVPVVVGIGHADDTHVLDLAASSSFPTPSAVGAWLVGLLDDQAASQRLAAKAAELRQAETAAAAAQRAVRETRSAADRRAAMWAAVAVVVTALVAVVLRVVGVW